MSRLLMMLPDWCRGAPGPRSSPRRSWQPIARGSRCAQLWKHFLSADACRFAPMQPADTAWMIVATGMVLLMTPALGFFYGGMVRAKSTLNTLMMSFGALGFVGLAWAFIGYSFAFGDA